MVINNKNQEKFESFVDFHNRCKDKRHIQGDKMYSDYDTMLGLSIIMTPISFIFINSFFGFLSLSLVIIFLVLTNTEITPKEKEIGKPSLSSTRKK